MTKKHFKQIAETINEMRETHGVNEVYVFPKPELYAIEGRGTKGAMLSEITMKLADLFAEQNDRFDYQRFSDACNGRPYRK